MISGLIPGKTFAKSLDFFAVLSSRNDPFRNVRSLTFPTFKVDLPRTVCGSVCLSVEKMTPFANTFDMFFPFDIVEYRALLSSGSTRFSCPVSTVSARNA